MFNIAGFYFVWFDINFTATDLCITEATFIGFWKSEFYFQEFFFLSFILKSEYPILI